MAALHCVLGRRQPCASHSLSHNHNAFYRCTRTAPPRHRFAVPSSSLSAPPHASASQLCYSSSSVYSPSRTAVQRQTTLRSSLFFSTTYHHTNCRRHHVAGSVLTHQSPIFAPTLSAYSSLPAQTTSPRRYHTRPGSASALKARHGHVPWVQTRTAMHEKSVPDQPQPPLQDGSDYVEKERRYGLNMYTIYCFAYLKGICTGRQVY